MSDVGCLVVSCGRTSRSRGLCERHYRRLLQHGSPTGGRAADGEALAWLLAHYDVGSDSPCVLWPYSTNGDGYGKVWVGGRYWRAHVYATVLRLGPAPEGRPLACHNCPEVPNRLCIVHSYWGSHSDNALDRERARRT